MLKIFSFITIVYLATCLFLYWQQRSMMYFPTAEREGLDTDHFLSLIHI